MALDCPRYLYLGLAGLLAAHDAASVCSWDFSKSWQNLSPLSPQVVYFQSALDKLNEAIKLAKVSLFLGRGTDCLYETHNQSSGPFWA